MSEYVNTYPLGDKGKRVHPMLRKDFYDQQIALAQDGKEPTRAVEVVNVFLFTTDGEVYIQKRSKDKRHNPGLLDKSMGGHMTVGDQADHTVMIETVQELQVPSLVVKHQDDFIKNLLVLKPYLDTIALIRHVVTDTHIFTKLIGGEEIAIANKYHFYVGVYGGRTKTVDKEAMGILRYTLDDLYDEAKRFPAMFTHDLHHYLAAHKQLLYDFVDQILYF